MPKSSTELGSSWSSFIAVVAAGCHGLILSSRSQLRFTVRKGNVGFLSLCVINTFQNV